VHKFSDRNIKDIQSIAHILASYNNAISILGIENKDKSQFIITRSNNIDVNIDDILKIISNDVDIKGGGNAHLVQGSCNKAELDKVLDIFYDRIAKNIKL